MGTGKGKCLRSNASIGSVPDVEPSSGGGHGVRGNRDQRSVIDSKTGRISDADTIPRTVSYVGGCPDVGSSLHRHTNSNGHPDFGADRGFYPDIHRYSNTHRRR